MGRYRSFRLIGMESLSRLTGAVPTQRPSLFGTLSFFREDLFYLNITHEFSYLFHIFLFVSVVLTTKASMLLAQLRINVFHQGQFGFQGSG